MQHAINGRDGQGPRREFEEQVREGGFTIKYLETHGFTKERLAELGFPADLIEALELEDLRGTPEYEKRMLEGKFREAGWDEADIQSALEAFDPADPD